MSAFGELAHLSRGALLARLRDAEADAATAAAVAWDAVRALERAEAQRAAARFLAAGWRRLAVEMLGHANREADAARAAEAARDENAEATFWCNEAIEQRTRADRAAMRLACWRLAEAFRTLGEGIAEQVCAACGWPRRIHKPDARWKRVTVDDTTYDKCAAFVAATETL